ncbi:hypothetical protein LWI28_008765 [Acer negundo]|uniref:RanBP2-type domain-containing protein n=1 Tax=Acer negundo TaxID=4023 RepID=A0AAD5J4Z9_ACENE|nr:hypothetical protein LWI28_008765 [Acer negundo]
MAQTPFSLLLLRRLSLTSRNPRPHFISLYFSNVKPFSTSNLPASNPTTALDSQSKPSSLSARMSFIFEQIDEIEKQKEEKDQTLQRIRAWRQSKQQQTTPNLVLNVENQQIDGGEERIEARAISKTEEIEARAISKTEENPDVISSVEENPGRVLDKREGVVRKTEVVVAHPWPEWIELMERLVKQNYFDHRRKDEDKMVRGLGFDDDLVVVEENGGGDDVGVDFNNFKIVQTACLNFGKDRFDILRDLFRDCNLLFGGQNVDFRPLSRQDIQILVGYGCPSADKKVVFSAKLLRKHVHLDEGDVCSSCSLRSSCERAYLLTNKEDEARTIDIMRVLLSYGFDPLNGSVVNKSLLKQKSVKTVVRKLLHEVVKLSAVPIDPNLPPPVIKKPPPKVKQPPPPPRKRVGRDDVEMKKGDWLCPKCDFMNFAKNTVCLQCDAKRSKRQLLPGEWECPECNFLNYRRNMACFHCDCKRPPDEFLENKMEERRQGPNMRMEKIAKRPEVSNAWNFDFDDDESDGADVAAFEYADSPSKGEDSAMVSQELDYDFNNSSRVRSPRERVHSELDSNGPGTGFDDFDDEDDVDSYEIDSLNNYSMSKASSNDFSEAEDIGVSGNNFRGHWRDTPPSNNKPSKLKRPKAAFSGSEDDELDFDTDEELPVHPNWKSSHVADSRHTSRDRGPTGPSRGLSFGSDEEFGPQSDLDDDFESRRTKKPVSGKFSRRRAGSDMEDFSDSESDNDDLDMQRNKFGRNKTESSRRGKDFDGRDNYNFVDDDARFRTNGKMDNRRNSMIDGSRSSRGSRGDNRGFKWDDYDGQRMNNKGDGARFRSNGKMDNRRDSMMDDRRSSRGSRGDNRGSKWDDYDRQRMNNKGDGARFRSNGKMDNRRDSMMDGRRSSRGSRGDNRGSNGDDYGGQRMNNRKGDSRNFRGPKLEGSRGSKHGMSHKYDMNADSNPNEFRNSRRVIER